MKSSGALLLVLVALLAFGEADFAGKRSCPIARR